VSGCQTRGMAHFPAPLLSTSRWLDVSTGRSLAKYRSHCTVPSCPEQHGRIVLSLVGPATKNVWLEEQVFDWSTQHLVLAAREDGPEFRVLRRKQTWAGASHRWINGRQLDEPHCLSELLAPSVCSNLVNAMDGPKTKTAARPIRHTEPSQNRRRYCCSGFRVGCLDCQYAS
jgi:hypothetical protein